MTECGTNERTDYSLEPRVIISSPRIKRQIKPTAGRGEAGHIDFFFFFFFFCPTGKVKNLEEFKEGKK